MDDEHALPMSREAVYVRRQGYWRMGYRPYPVWSPGAVDHHGEPVRNAGKRAWGANWRERALENPPWAAEHHPDSQALNTGLLTGELVAIDVDIMDPAIVDQVCALIERAAGISPLVRQGQPPKVAMCYRTAEPFTKIATKKLVLPESADGKPLQVEVLGNGQGLTIDGVHPGTLEQYHWTGEGPLDVPFDQLPELNEEQARHLIGTIEDWLRQAGCTDWVDPNRPEPKPSRREPAAHGNGSNLSGSGFVSQVRELALSRIPDWLPWIFPKAKKAPNGAWRSPATERGLPSSKQDLSVHPTEGIVDFHTGDTFSAIDLVVTYATAGGESIEQRTLRAALWLCERMHVDPHTVGYQDAGSRSAGAGGAAKTNGVGNGHAAERDGLIPPVGPPLKPPNGGDGPAAMRVIQVKAGLRHLAADAGLDALVEDRIPIYTRGTHLVEVRRTKAKDSRGQTIMIPELGQISSTNMARHLGRIAEWQRFDRRVGGWVRFDPPPAVVDMVLDMVNEWSFPPITGLAATPTMRPDGSLLIEPGYDGQTGMVLIFDHGFRMPAIAERPSKRDAEVALASLCELLAHFPFVDNRSRSVALSLLMTPVVRSAMDVAPLHAVTAPLPGTGKSFLIDLASMIATGERAAVHSMAKDDAETEKRLIGAAIGGYPIIVLDNISRLVDGDFLAQISERPYLRVRPLGTSEMMRIKNTFTMIADGNNLAFGSDMIRRTLKCALDANMADPETRQFPFDPMARVLADRGHYVSAVLTIVRAYAVSGETPLPAVGSYQQWSDWVRSSLVWLGEDDPLGTMQDLRDDDPSRQRRGEIFELWSRLPMAERQTRDGITVSELIQAAEIIIDMREALIEVAEGHSRSGFAGKIDPRRLAAWLRANHNAVAAGYKLVVNRADKQRPRWAVRPVAG